MAVINTLYTDVLNTWRTNFNQLSINVGDQTLMYQSDGLDLFAPPSSLIAAVNDLNSRKVKRDGDTITDLVVSTFLTVGTTLTVTGASSFSSGTFSSTLGVTGASTLSAVTVGGATQLNGSITVGVNKVTIDPTTGNTSIAGTLSVAGASTLGNVGATNITASGTLSVTGNATVAALSATNITASGTLSVTGNATVAGLSASGVITSTVAIGTAPFIVTSTTPVANLSIGGNAASATTATNVSGIVALANGGTGSNIVPAVGGVLYSGASTLSLLAAVATAGHPLISGASAAPSWLAYPLPTTIGTANSLLGVNAGATGTEFKVLTSSGGSIAISYTAGGINIDTTSTSGGTTYTGNVYVGSPTQITLSTTGYITATGLITGSGFSTTGASNLAVTTATTPSVDSNNTNVATTAYVQGQGSVTAPVMDGVAAVGVSTRWAHGDHVHPSDTSRASTANPSFTGTIDFNSATDIQNTNTSTSSTSLNQVIASYPIATYRSVEFIIQAVNSIGNVYHSSTIKAIHDGTNVTSTEYAATYTANGPAATFSSAINAGNLQLLATPTSSNVTVFKITAILTLV